jgi:glycosyltransferase involved in cell wall biosynthesis
MKILYHHRTLSKDGQNVHIDEMLAAFRRAGHEVRVVGPASHANAAFGSDGGLLSRIRSALPAPVAEFLELAYSVPAFVRLWQTARQFKPDLLYERYNLFLLAGAWLRKLTGLTFVVEVNAPLALERSQNSGLALERLGRWSERYVWRAADVVLPVTAVLGRYVEQAGVAPARIKAIPNGIDPQQFSDVGGAERVRAMHGLADKLIVGFTGFLRDWHGLPAVIDVMRDLKAQYPLHFLVVGDGPARDDLRRQAIAAGLERDVTVTGLVERADIPAHVAAFDIAIQPKATAYASPLKLFEYMALGRAIIAPDQPNLREVLSDGSNALLFDPGDVSTLKTALRRLVEDAPLRKSLGVAAAATIKERELTWDGNVSRTLAAVSQCARPRV